jgi:hypothetical protein
MLWRQKDRSSPSTQLAATLIRGNDAPIRVALRRLTRAKGSDPGPIRPLVTRAMPAPGVIEWRFDGTGGR